MIRRMGSLAVAVLAFTALAGCQAAPTTATVTYRVTFGDRDGDLTGKDVAPVLLPTLAVSYTTRTGSAQENGTPREDKLGLVQPWTKTVHVTTGTKVTLTATNDDSYGGYGSITCSITAAGKVVSTNTARGANVTATCTETVE